MKYKLIIDLNGCTLEDAIGQALQIEEVDMQSFSREEPIYIIDDNMQECVAVVFKGKVFESRT